MNTASTHFHTRAQLGLIALACGVLLNCGGSAPTTEPKAAPAGTRKPSAGASELNIANGATMFLHDGELPASGDAEFVIGETKGALVLIQAIAREKDLKISVYRADTGEEIKDQHPNYSVWVAHLPATLGYLVVVHGTGAATPYSLKIETPRRLFFDPATQTAEVKGAAAGHAEIAYVAPPSKAIEATLESSIADSYLTIHNLEGRALLKAQDNKKTFSGPRLIPTDDVLIRVHQGPKTGDFGLKVKLQK